MDAADAIEKDIIPNTNENLIYFLGKESLIRRMILRIQMRKASVESNLSKHQPKASVMLILNETS